MSTICLPISYECPKNKVYLDVQTRAMKRNNIILFTKRDCIQSYNKNIYMYTNNPIVFAHV